METMIAGALGREILAWAVERVEGMTVRYLSDGRWPRRFAGYAVSRQDVADWAYVLEHLHRLGVREVAGKPVEQGILGALLQVSSGEGAGGKKFPFACYRVAEALLEFGAFEGNALLKGVGAEAREKLAWAVDASGMYDPATGKLPGYPNNYWAVLARCELRRGELGLPGGEELLGTAVRAVEGMLGRNALGFMDDSVDFAGRFDLYSPDVVLFSEPLWGRMDAGLVARVLSAHARYFEVAGMESGAWVGWGRSIGALSVCATLEFGALALRRGFANDRGLVMGRTAHAFSQLKGWFADDLISAHRGRMTYKYRDVHRLLQMSLDVVGKALYAAEQLIEMGDVAVEVPDELFGARDAWVPFEGGVGGAGVWVYRGGGFAFQLPVVAGVEADYTAWPRQAGVLDAPVDTDMVVGGPRVVVGDAEYIAAGRATSVNKVPGGLVVRYGGFVPARSMAKGAAGLAGTREVRFQVEGPRLRVSEAWKFDQLPDEVGVDVAESGRALRVEVAQSVTPVTQSVVEVSGMQAYRSYFAEITRWHQMKVLPAKEMGLEYVVSPAMRVVNCPGGHDYNRALFDGFGAAVVEEMRVAQGLDGGVGGGGWRVGEVKGRAEIFHMGWPEHMFGRPEGMSEAEHDAVHERFVRELKASGMKVVLTMHNARPHNKVLWPDARADWLYRLYAGAVHGVIHHSEYGRGRMMGDLPWRKDAVHVVLPHGHFGEQMRVEMTRAELEKKYGLGPCGVRMGILGRYQKEKQIEMLIEAFVAGASADAQLVVTAQTEGLRKPDDPRVVLIPRPQWLTRGMIAEHNHLCDVLLSAHVGERYLTSGIQADAIGVGVAMVVPEWAFFREMLGEAAWYHGNTVESVREAISRVSVAEVERRKVMMRGMQASFDWRRIAAGVGDLYARLLS